MHPVVRQNRASIYLLITSPVSVFGMQISKFRLTLSLNLTSKIEIVALAFSDFTLEIAKFLQKIKEKLTLFFLFKQGTRNYKI